MAEKVFVMEKLQIQSIKKVSHSLLSCHTNPPPQQQHPPKKTKKTSTHTHKIYQLKFVLKFHVEKTSEENSGVHGSWGQNEAKIPLSAEKVKAAAKAGLAAAATKAKLFADHEEREIQRLSANIINHQV